MRICPKCHQVYADGRQFCRNDGTQLNEVPASNKRSVRSCARCAELLVEADVFCPKCGTPVSGVPSRQAPASTIANVDVLPHNPGVLRPRPEPVDSSGETSPSASSQTIPSRRLPIGLLLGALVLIVAVTVFVVLRLPSEGEKALRIDLERGDVVQASQEVLARPARGKLRAATLTRYVGLAEAWLSQALIVWKGESLAPAGGWASAAAVAQGLAAAEPEARENAFRRQYIEGQALFDTQQWAGAQNAFRAASAANDPLVRALSLNGLGKSCWRLKDPLCAEDAYRRAIATDPTWVFPQQNLAGVLFQTGQLELSEQAYRMALSLAGHRAAIHLGLAELLFSTKRFDEAQMEYELARSSYQPTDDAELLNLVNRRLEWLAARSR